ncbi:MAG: histidinol-phosphate aminotransferase family protein [SAR202 cluster bacterium]|nr:histidinol-phosphate aminotransferase family protein [SAR202 cluster bacterium]
MSFGDLGRPVHGGLDAEELAALGLRPEEVLDFSASINPLGPPPSVVRALASLDLAAYPDRDCRDLRLALARRLEVSPEWVQVGNGSMELIHLLARAFLAPGDGAVIFTPTFGEYEAACRLQGAGVVEVRARETDGFQWSIGEFSAAGGATRGFAHQPQKTSRLVFLCNPNNPTGAYLARDDVERVITTFPQATVVLDEAYATFADEPWDSVPLLRHRNVVLLHSMTKTYAIPSLRLGYAVGHPEILDHTRRFQPSWSVNGAAQAAGLAALGEDAYLRVARACAQEGKAVLCEMLEAAGLRVTRGAANFVLVEVGDARAVRRRLLERRLCVRDCASFGLPRHVRIGVRTPQECGRLAEALIAVMTDEVATRAR